MKNVSNPTIWHSFMHLSGRLHVLIKDTIREKAFAPLYIHTFRVIRAHLARDMEWAMDVERNPDLLVTVADKLKLQRHQMGLTQKEAARQMGVERTTYARYESAKDAGME